MGAPAVTVAPSDLESAERRYAFPRRAEGVQLMGEIPGSGYRRAPSLARRSDGQTVKLTPILYRLLESIDGSRGYDALADELSRNVGKRASAKDVRYLIEEKLRPLGVLQEADGGQAELKRANPLLALQLRVIVSKAAVTRRLIAPFVWLFKPAVMVPVLAGFAALTWWLVAEKGLSSALHQAFYDPVMILAIWALVVLSAAFHEIGHAAACRYGGARPGVMGAGLYLVWPAFYTEVSDSYRLDRRGRLRVDLGGLYFNAIFALATGALWAATGNDAVLLVIAAQLLQMVRQLGPFLRADGYHIVADLTGVPDLFGQIKPTLLGLLPTRWGRPEHKLLKPWARAVVSGWVLLVVPMLAAMLGYMVLFLPRLAATAWDSMGREWAGAMAFWAEGNPAGFAVKLISAAIVALPVLAIVYLLFRISRRAGRRTWAATSGRPVLRAAAVVAATALAALVTWAWWPRDQYEPIRADEAGPVPAVAPTVVGELAQQQLVLSAPAPTAAVPGLTGAAPATVVEGSSETPPALQPGGGRIDEEPPAAGLAPAGLEHSAAWPFPFDPPDVSDPGDNLAMAVNTEDDSVLSVIATSLLMVTGDDPVDETNAAYALASCSDCKTIAVAFQVILIIGYVQEITPANTAVAVNYGCDTCTTAAFAYQLILTLLEAPSAEVQAQLTSILARLEALEDQLGSLTLEQLDLALEQIELDLAAALADSIAAANGDAALTSGEESAGGGAAGGSDTGLPAPSAVTPPGSGSDSDAATSPGSPEAETTTPETSGEQSECPDPDSDPDTSPDPDSECPAPDSESPTAEGTSSSSAEEPETAPTDYSAG